MKKICFIILMVSFTYFIYASESNHKIKENINQKTGYSFIIENNNSENNIFNNYLKNKPGSTSFYYRPRFIVFGLLGSIGFMLATLGGAIAFTTLYVLEYMGITSWTDDLEDIENGIYGLLAGLIVCWVFFGLFLISTVYFAIHLAVYIAMSRKETVNNNKKIRCYFDGQAVCLGF